MPSNEHISTRFDSELDEIRNAVLQMAELVETQAQGAMDALLSGDVSQMSFIIKNDHQVNMMEVNIDELSVEVVARRQPTARDLRLLMAVSKTVTDLERIGDEAQKIARMGKFLTLKNDLESSRFHEIVEAAEIALAMLRQSMQAFMNLDVELAAQTMNFDDQVDERFKVVMRRLVACMIEDPRTISRSLAMMNIVKAVERMGDHAQNISEYVIYMVKGRDVRHLKRSDEGGEIF